MLSMTACNNSGSDSANAKTAELRTRTCAPEKELLAAGIIGGTRVYEGDTDVKNVMMLYSSGELCTATAITPRVLLTAAHCVNGPAVKAWIGLHSSLSCESGFDSRYNTASVKEFITHPEYRNLSDHDESLNDIALVFLNEALPLDYSIYRIAHFNQVTVKNSLYFWGYGDTDYKKGGAGILRKTVFQNKDFKIFSDQRKIKVDQSQGHGICQGDSGGPALVKIENELQILGINSYVETSGAKDTLCTNKAYLTLVESYIPWIAQVLKNHNEALKN